MSFVIFYRVLIIKHIWYIYGSRYYFVTNYTRGTVNKNTELEMEPPSSDCPLTPCIKLLAGAWTLEIIWHIKNKPKRYGQLRRLLGKISSKVLTTRLRQLQGRDVVFRKVTPTVPPMVEYGLTENGRKLIPVLNAISKVKINPDPKPKGRKDE
ncbi:hypothetical protein MNBD_NITROSPINAE04-1604 [hydrothermal vent metagenome]|uniref:HTH hxlR-type domain-containing protein n=1 Tax=hydrothermal vent metagenome TaxID=652676 RepID=A0A3B1CYA6_9ZZZZ